MTTLINLIKQRYIHLAGLAALCALIWFAGPLLSFANIAPLQGELSRVLAMASLITGGIAWIAFQHVRAGKKDQMLMTEISAPAIKTERAAIEEAQSEEIAGLRRKFEEALQLLKTTRSKGKRDKQYLYELPWYVIIGGPGTGKTTLLQNSGLQFPLAERLGRHAVRGVGGTRDCDWFFTDEAIFLDTAGRYTTQDSHQPVDKAAWKGFLDLIKKNRPRRPINGVVLTMSMSELLLETEDNRRQHTRELRQRIMELYEMLGNRFPIYMVFTKCDLIAGFTDFFSDLSQEDRFQVWGETFPGDGPRQVENNLATLETHYDVVLGRMEQRVFKRMQEERDVQRRSLIMSFPQQMAMLKPTIVTFLAEVFGSSRYEMEPLLRGVYFTSATQEGTPIDRMMGVLAKAYGMDRQEAPVFSGRGKSFFITRLLREVIFPEAELAGLDPRIERRRRWLRWASYAALVTVMAGMLTLWTVSYLENSRAIARVEEHIKQYRAVPGQWGESETAIRTVVARLNALSEARNEYRNRSWLMGFGLYQGDKIEAGIDEVYERRLVADLLPEINRRLKMHMREILQRGQAADSGSLYELLRVYLMLGLPEKKDTKVASASIRKSWERNFAREPQVADQLAGHSDYLLNIFHDPIPLDQELVRNVQQRLKSVPLATQLYSHLKSVALADHSHDFRLMNTLPPVSMEIFTTPEGRSIDSLTIPGFFSAYGYNTYFRKQGQDLVKRALQESWVLNQYAGQTGDLASLYDDLQKQYFAEYETLWKKLLMSLKMKKPQGIFDTLKILDYLSGPETPLRPLLQAVEMNTCLSTRQEDDKSEGKPKEAATGEKGAPFLMQGKQEEPVSGPAYGLESSFQSLNRLVQTKGQAPAPLEDILRSIQEVRDLILKITSGAGSEEQALKFAKERMHGLGAGDVIKKANLSFARLPEPLKDWLGVLTSSGWELTMDQAKTELNNIWRTEVVAHYMAGLNGRYPLFSNSRQDATMADFSRFFAPGGIINRFFESYIKPFVDTSGPVWKQVSMDSQSMRLSAGVLNQFQYAAKIRDAFFAPGETTPSVRFHLKPVALDTSVLSFRISIDGQTEEYSHGPSFASQFQWPGPHPNMGVVLAFMTPDGRVVSQAEDGPWAWLKTLEKTTIERTGLPDLFIATFQVAGNKARYELRANSVYNPFNLVELKNFRCPESL